MMALAFSPAIVTVVDSSVSSLSAFAKYSCSSSSSLSASHGFLQQRSRRLSGIGGGSSSSSRPRSSSLLVVRASDILGDFGARDPTTIELESNFGDKVIGFAGTDHNILIPSASQFGLAEKSCKPLAPGTPALSEDEAKALLRKVVGWRISRTDAGLKLQGDWNLKDFKAGLELFNRIAVVAEAENHHPDLHLESYKKGRVEIWTHSIGGLSENDFILAAKIDQIDTRDLVSRKNKFWA
jgi:4a-hydroxytetrahydrobiopterin dehydratase